MGYLFGIPSLLRVYYFMVDTVYLESMMKRIRRGLTPREEMES